MKKLFLVFAVCLSGLFTSCKKDCGQKIAACGDIVPTNEACAAAFNRWFFNKASNKCEQKAYSGCSQKGFATQQECEACKCDD